MLETAVLPVTDDTKKLKRDDFNKKYRFRPSRKEGLVNCASCAYMSGGTKSDEVAFCQNPERLRQIKIAEYFGSFFGKGESENISSKRVCDAYANKPLPADVIVPSIPEKHAAVLGTQWRDPYHADPNCPYVVEELRMIKTGGKTEQGRTGEIEFIDLSNLVDMEAISRQICEMPGCNNKLPYQTLGIDEYRRAVGIKPDGREPKIWVRNGIVKHGRNSSMTLEEAESFFDLTAVVQKYQSVHNQIVAVSDYLRKGYNWLGSRPLSEASNPVGFSNRHHFLDEPIPRSFQHSEQFWAYDERLFDKNTRLKGQLLEMEKIPEGFILCLDSKGVLRNGISSSREESPRRFLAYGILRPMKDPNLLSKGVDYFMDIREVHYSGGSHWGEFGIGFNGLASFHEE